MKKVLFYVPARYIYDCGNCLKHNSQDIFSPIVCLGCFVVAWRIYAEQG